MHSPDTSTETLVIESDSEDESLLNPEDVVKGLKISDFKKQNEPDGYDETG